MALPLLLLFGSSAMAADSLVVSLQVSQYNGFQVSCFGEKDGWIDLTVTGGTTPYSYKWSNGSVQQDLAQLAAGYYKVDVLDNAGLMVTTEVTLDQPLPLRLDVDVYEYANGYNISCYDCNNGNVSVMVLGGAAPFTVNWSDGPTGANRYNLGPRDYKITVADANGCAGTSNVIYLRGPERSNWGMDGNANTTPGPQYIGTSDNKDVVLKSNGQERLRLKADGDIGLWGADTLTGPLYRGPNGMLKVGDGYGDYYPETRCFLLRSMPYWQTRGNNFHLCDGEPDPILGTLSDDELRVVTHGVERMRISRTGQIGIGTDPPIGPMGDYRLFVENGIQCRDVLVKLGAWQDDVFKPRYELMPLGELRDFLKKNSHLPGIPAEAELRAKGGVEVGDIQVRMLKVVEEQALYILQLEEKQKDLEQRLSKLEAAQR